MVDSVAKGAAKAIAQLVGAQAWEEISLVWGFHDHVHKLKEKLLDTQEFLEDVGNAQHSPSSRLVNGWILKVKDAAYFADNVMDDYVYEKLRRKIELPSETCLCNFLNYATNPVVFRFKMTHKVLAVLSEFEKLDKQAKDIGLQQVSLVNEAASSSSYSNRTEGAKSYKLNQIREHGAAAPYVGRKDDEKTLLQLICGPKSTSMEGDLCTIAIQGIGGLGKTTLAKRLFDHEEVDKHFGKKKVWICVSDDFNVDRVLKVMLESLAVHNYRLSHNVTIKRKLQETLKGEKFLLVLDDVWETNPDLWDTLRSELQRIGDPSKSVILISTRIMEVANKAQAIPIHRLNGLSDDDGWTLLRQKASIPITPNQEYSKFKDIGIRIVQKCKGVPLAIKAMGPLLRSRKSLSEWENILESELSELPQYEENYILPSLQLSYDHLPSESVKQCFAYCAIFPKDTELEKLVLITLWMAQGFLYKSKTTTLSSTMEEIGEEYFADLLNNSFLQEEGVVDEIDEITETKRYKMHDLVHDLATSLLKEDMLVLKSDLQEKKVSSNIRHFVINTPEFPTQVAMHNLRTISFWVDLPRCDSIICAQYLRVLILDHNWFEIPNDIGQLIHLRFLEVSGGDDIVELPESICKLYQLQTLRIRGIYNLKELPRELVKLENLRHIFEDGIDCFMPRGLGLLTNLQTSPALNLYGRDDEWTIDELENLNQIKGKMRITGVEHVKSKEEARKASLGSKGGISFLILEWRTEESNINNVVMNNIDEDVLDSLEPHPNIKAFEVTGFMGEKFPSWIKKMNNLSRLVLEGCKRCKQLPTLGQLPFLKTLELIGFTKVECIGNEFYHDESSINNIMMKEEVVFGALRELTIDSFESLTTWMAAGTRAFPRLEILEILSCPILETVQTSYLQSSQKHDLCLEYSGMWSPSLKKLCIRNCPALSCNLELSPLQSLEELIVINAGEMMTSAVARSLQQLHRLTSLWIGGFRDDKDIIKFASQIKPSTPHPLPLKEVILWEWPKVKNLPPQLQHLLIPSSSTLEELTIWEFDELEALPEWMGNLSSLQVLRLHDCKELKYLPSKQAMLRLSQLRVLDIYNCPILKERCDKHNVGPQSLWPSIQHIPDIFIDM